jgi:hypothetical protein|tara:strand:- start:169 stop:438 length:270 start_codon:yes stop_codon:yes gene_type:complete
MAPKRSKNPGKTSKYYQSAKGRKSYNKQKKKQKKINSTAAKRAYRRTLARKRRELGIMGKGGKDVSHKGNRLKLEIPKKNRARGGAKRK